MACLLAASCAAPTPATHRDAPDAAIVAAVLVWNTGINQPDGPSSLIETVLPAMLRGQRVWRVVHRDSDPTQSAINDYDMYDVAAANLSPIRSATNREDVTLVLTFTDGRVTIDRRAGGDHTTLEVATNHPVPEGPGQTVWLAAQPLAEGYRASVEIVDRWASDLSAPNRVLDLAVVSTTTIVTPMGSCRAYEVTLTARDGSFRIRQWVRASPPHYPLKTDYRRGDFVYVSEVVRIAMSGPPACEPPAR